MLGSLPIQPPSPLPPWAQMAMFADSVCVCGCQPLPSWARGEAGAKEAAVTATDTGFKRVTPSSYCLSGLVASEEADFLWLRVSL